MSESTADQAEPTPQGATVVDEVLASLEGLEERPLEEHVAVFESAHERLRGALNDAARPAPGA